MSIEWLKKEVEKEIEIVSQAFGKAEKEGEKEFEILKSKILQDTKTLTQSLKNLMLKEEAELKQTKTTLTKDLSSLQNKLNKLEKKEKQKLITEINRLKLKIRQKKVQHLKKKEAVKEINKFQTFFQKTKTGIEDSIKKLIVKTEALTKEEKKTLFEKIKKKHEKDTAAFHKEVEKLSQTLYELRKLEKKELRTIKEELKTDVEKIKKLLPKKKEFQELVKKDLENLEKNLKTFETKESQAEQALKQDLANLQKNLNTFMIKEKKQTRAILDSITKKIRGTGVKIREEGGKELEIFKNKTLEDIKALLGFLEKSIAQEEAKIKHTKKTLKKEIILLQSKANKLEAEEKQKIITELTKLKSKLQKKRIEHAYKKKAIEKAKNFQNTLQKIKTTLEEKTKKLAKKAEKLTQKEKNNLIESLKKEHEKDTVLFHKEVGELNNALNNLKKVEGNEIQIIKDDLKKDVFKIKKIIRKSKSKNEEAKKIAINSIKNLEKTLQNIKTKEPEIEKAVKQKINNLQENLNIFVTKEKKQTHAILNSITKKIKETEIKTKEEGKGLEKYILKLFKMIKKEKKTEDQLLKETALNKLNALERKKLDQQVFDDFAWVLKVFLSNHLKIGYEYTHQELINELTKKRTKHREDIIRLSEEIVEVDFEGKKVDENEFKRMVGEAKKIIREV